jgi:hypothetical protein
MTTLEIILSIVCAVLLFVCIRQKVTSRILQRIYTQSYDTNRETQDNYRSIIATLKGILKSHNIDLGNTIENYSVPLEKYAHKLMDLRNSDTRIPLEVYNKICDLEKEMLTTFLVLEREAGKRKWNR